MRTTNLLLAGGFVLASGLALGPVVAQTPPPVFKTVVTNTPLPVTGTVGLSGPVTATLSGNPTVSAIVTNTATNPVPVSNGDRPTAFNQSFVTGGNTFTSVPVPTGCRLVIQAVSYFVQEPTPTGHLPVVTVAAISGGSASFVIPYQQQVVNDPVPNLTLGTVAMHIFVDSPNLLSVHDVFGQPTDTGTFAIAGYLLPLTPGASC